MTASLAGRTRSQLIRLLVYYLALIGVVALIWTFFPSVYDLLIRSAVGGDVGLEGFAEQAARGVHLEAPGQRTAGTLLAVIGALAVMLPVAWVYMTTKEREGYDRSVVQTLIMLPIAIAGVVVIVQNSIALAFSLAGIVAAVRFRNTLKDTKDAVYIFLAIAVGLSAGVRALDVAAVVSVLFNVVILVLWWSNFGNVYAGEPADRAERLREYVNASEGMDKKERPNALVLVHASDAAAAQVASEAVFGDTTKVWQLVEITPAEDDTTTLEYLVRIRKSVPPASLIERIKATGAPHVVAAEFRSLKGLSA